MRQRVLLLIRRLLDHGVDPEWLANTVIDIAESAAEDPTADPSRDVLAETLTTTLLADTRSEEDGSGSSFRA